MSEFKRMPKMATSEPTVTLALKGGGPVKKAMGGSLPMAPMKAPMAPRRPSSGASMGKPMVEGNMASRAMKQKMMKKARPGMPEAAMPAMKEGGKAEKHSDAAQDRAMIKKAMAGKKFATGGVVNGQDGYATGGVVNGQDGYKKGGSTKALRDERQC